MVKKKVKNRKNKKAQTEKNTSIYDDELNATPQYYNNTNYDLEIKKSTIESAGLGVFSLEEIPKKTYIGMYEGKQIRNKVKNRSGVYFFEINKSIGIDASNYPRCYMAMINDTYKSEKELNCEFIVDENKKSVEIWSIKDIDVGSELFVSYGKDYWIDSEFS